MKQYTLLFTTLTLTLSLTTAYSQWFEFSPHARSTVSGNVGIGTAENVAPEEKLHVEGNVRANQFNTFSGVLNAPNGNLMLQTGGTARLSVLNANGFVGIGITPTEMLHVNGNVLSNQYTATNGIFNSSGNLSLATNGTSRLSLLSSNGYVGVGIATPEEKFHISGGNLILDNGGTPTIYTGTGTAQLNRYLQIKNSAGAPDPSGIKAGGLLIADSYTYANPSKNDLVVKGKVSIGTTLSNNPNNYTLAVNGKIGAKDMQVETNSATWPDYVFTSGYHLPSLYEVENYIAKNNHLRDVPSATEIEQNHNLGEMDAILLKKVEELTLYIIEQQKQIDSLKKKLDEKECRACCTVTISYSESLKAGV